MSIAFLGLGSNKGERISYLNKAVDMIKDIKKTKIIRTSSVYETEPWGVSEQEDYLNSVIEIETPLDARSLLIELKNIEKTLGRIDSRKWAEREIDIDLLFFENEIVDEGSLKVPHPQLENRKFVLVPMNEISPDFIHPVLGKKISELLNETSDNLSVKKYEIEGSVYKFLK